MTKHEIPQGSRTTQGQTPAGGRRKLQSWIEEFVSFTADIGTPEITRRWTAISTLASILEQKVWLQTAQRMFPNMFIFLVSPPGIGKSRIMNAAREIITTAITDPYIAPTSINAATLSDQMRDSKRSGLGPDMKTYEYNCLSIMVGEFGTFMSKWEPDMVAMLSDFYGVTPYGQRRRGGDIKFTIERPLLNMLIGCTPATLERFMPEDAWEQGFTSRIVFVHSDDKLFVDDFAAGEVLNPPDALVADLKIINDLYGKFGVTDEYKNVVNMWRQADETFPNAPKPSHPKLTHYNTRRKEHLYHLSMIASVDRDNSLLIDKECFNTAMGWMIEAEGTMPAIFKTASEVSSDRAMSEIHHHVREYNVKEGKAMSELKLVRFVQRKVRSYEVLNVIELMVKSGGLNIYKTDAVTRVRYFTAPEGGSVDPGQHILQ